MEMSDTQNCVYDKNDMDHHLTINIDVAETDDSNEDEIFKRNSDVDEDEQSVSVSLDLDIDLDNTSL
jgi:hypothetical protein